SRGAVQDADVLVVGAGPAGTTAAYGLARRGHDVLVVEEHARVGHPVQCAGLVSQRVLDLAGTREMVRHSVRGATVFSPSLRAVPFKATDTKAFVIDRSGLDLLLADRAVHAGARVQTGVRFDGVVGRDAGRVRVRLTDTDGVRHELNPRLVIGADGVSSAVARAFRLRRPIEILPAFEAEYPNSPGDPEQVEVYLGNDLSPGLFGWWIPDGAGGARVGVAARAGPVSARVYFDRLARHVERRFGTPLRNPTAFLVSGIPIGLLPRTSTANALLVGDSAAQVKPLSGGGIFTGMRCAEIAAELAHTALSEKDLSSASLERYDSAWKAVLGDEFSKALYLRRLFVRLTDADLERIVEALQGAELSASIVAFGDIDFPTHVARQLLSQSPSLLRLFPKALSALLSSGERFAPDLDFGPRRMA
ncbi:MAG: NAD(P)/FAD-dependent oxidoreductase, partial [Thermoplasmata archaeon]|nr:NAD(P)/FAD-dependent oxidoreductase [Thermoplasmata archaeon]